MGVGELLRKLEPLTHDARVRRMVELGRAATTDRDAAELLGKLAQGDVFQRFLALMAVHGSRDGAAAARGAGDPSRLIRRAALKLVALCSSDGQALDVLRQLGARERRALVKHLWTRGRHGPIDALLDEQAARGDRDIDRLLAYGSLAAVSRHRETVAPRGGVIFWSRLARLHADAARDALTERVHSAGEDDPRLLPEAGAALTAMAAARPDAALTLAAVLAARFPLGKIPLGGLLRHRPAGVADLLLASSDEVSLDLRPVAHRLKRDRLRALLKCRPSLLLGSSQGFWSCPPRRHWLLRLDPARRRTEFLEVQLALRDAEGVVPRDLIERLPGDLRREEARRHLALPALATRPEVLMPYAGLLPWDEARRAVDPWLGHPDGQRRAAALSALASAVKYNRDRLAEFLGLAVARRHEQDPVRLAMLTGLAALPTAAVRPAHLDALGLVIRHALDAADLSCATAAAAQTLVVRLLPACPAWAAEWLETLVRERGHVSIDSLESRISDADAGRLAQVLEPVLDVWVNREREPQLVLLAAALGNRLRAFEPLRVILGRLARDARTPYVAAQALDLLRRHDPPRRARLVPELVASDPSWATQPAVYEYLHRRRQDLITPFLGQKAYSGRFSTGKTRFVLPLTGGFVRWTPKQQATFAATLTEISDARDRARDTPAVLQAINRLAALPSVEPVRLSELTRDVRPAVAEAALRALGRLDSDAGVPLLLDALRDDRARVAVYALRRALLGMPAAHAIDLLRTAPLDRVTVAKEVIRLVGEFPGDEAFAWLRITESQPLHRDVRVALLRAYWSHLDRPEAWEAIEQAAGESDPALVSGVVRIPADRLAPDARRRLAGVLVKLLEHTDPYVRQQVLERCVNDPVGDPEGRLLAAVLDSLDSPLPDERRVAGQAVVAGCRASDASRVGDAVSRRLGPHHRRSLVALVQPLTAAVPRDRMRLAPAARAVLDALAADPLTGALRVALAMASLSVSDLIPCLGTLAADDLLHADALRVAAEAVASTVSRPGESDVDGLEASLGTHHDARVRRIGLAALVARANVLGWDADRLARLRTYRGDPSPLVAAAAQFTFADGDAASSGN